MFKKAKNTEDSKAALSDAFRRAVKAKSSANQSTAERLTPASLLVALHRRDEASGLARARSIGAPVRDFPWRDLYV